MKKLLIAAIAVSLVMTSSTVMSTQKPVPDGERTSRSSRILAEFPASSLKWIQIAEPEFRRRQLDVEKYVLSVYDVDDDSVGVLLTEWGLAKQAETGILGNPGKLPGFEVVIGKKDRRIVRANYIR
jgi:hypothetical protein